MIEIDFQYNGFTAVFRLLLLIFIFSVSFGHGTYADPMPDFIKNMTEEERAEYEYNVLKNYQYTEEDYQMMVDFYKGCQRDGTSLNYNCECLANEYIKKKVVYYDTISNYQIFQETGDKCIDVVRVAGNTYSDCMRLGEFDKRWNQEFCECYANYFAKSYKEYNGNMSLYRGKKTRREGMKECNYNPYRADVEQERRRVESEIAKRAREKLGVQ